MVHQGTGGNRFVFYLWTLFLSSFLYSLLCFFCILFLAASFMYNSFEDKPNIIRTRSMKMSPTIGIVKAHKQEQVQKYLTKFTPNDNNDKEDQDSNDSPSNKTLLIHPPNHA